jgi:hypothetical protein
MKRGKIVDQAFASLVVRADDQQMRKLFEQRRCQ